MIYLLLFLLSLVVLFLLFPTFTIILLIIGFILVIMYVIGDASEKNPKTCPKCGSKDLIVLKKTRSNFSTSKATLGAMLYGKKGIAAGLFGDETKGGWVCKNCGHQFMK